MKNKFNSISVIAGSVMTIAIFAFAFGAFPKAAEAYGYSHGYNRAADYAGCEHPTVFSNGYYMCNYRPTIQPVNYTPSYPSYPPYNYPQPRPPLSVTCYPNSSSVPTGASVQWVASPMGGDGSFSYNWSGSDGLAGTGQTAVITYSYSGIKNGSVTVYSAGQSISTSCSNYVTVNNVISTYPVPVYPVAQYYPNYGYSGYQYSPLSASCVANTTSAPIGTPVTWTATATGGNGYYQYSWTGTDGIYGQGQTVAYNYSSPGTKYASVTVYSNGQTLTQSCSNILNVGVSIGGIYSTNVNSNIDKLDVACYADPTSVGINQAVNWTAEVTRGSGQYAYTWTGSDGLSGSQSTAIKFYTTSGLKTAVVNVTSSDGKTGSHACSVTVRSSAGTAVTSTQQSTQSTVSQRSNQNLSAASAFSLGSIPWGWVAVLVILILFAMVMYLLFNKPKI